MHKISETNSDSKAEIEHYGKSLIFVFEELFPSITKFSFWRH